MLLNFKYVSASPYSYYFGSTRDFIEQGMDTITEILSPLFEIIIGDYSSSEFFFSKVLLFILLLIVIIKILEKTPLGENNKKVNIIISILVSIISIRFINENSFFESIFIQYGVLGIAITTIIPLVIFFFFVHNTKVGTYGRKMFWLIYIITLMAIWISKSSELSEVSNWIYGLTILTAGILLFFDKDIHSYFGLTHLRKFQKENTKETILRAKERIVKINERFDKGIIPLKDYLNLIKEQEQIIKELSKDL